MLRWKQSIAAGALALATAAVSGRGNVLINGNFEAGNTGFTASAAYTDSASTDTGPGYYGVTKNPSNVGGFLSFGDHTTGNGLMLFVDASPTPLTAFWSETVSVAPNTNYAFTGFAREAGTYPNTGTIRLLVNGVAVGADLSLAQGSAIGSWQSFTDQFNAGANSHLTLSLVDANPSPGVGNDFVVDDLAAAPTPEPSTAVIAMVGVTFMLARRCKRDALSHV